MKTPWAGDLVVGVEVVAVVEVVAEAVLVAAVELDRRSAVPVVVAPDRAWGVATATSAGEADRISVGAPEADLA